MAQPNQNSPHLSPEAIRALLSAATWARSLGILGIIAAVIVIGMAAFQGLDTSSLTMFILVVAILLLLPAFFLLRFAGKAKAAAINGRTDQFDEAFNALKGFLLICNVVALLVILAYIILNNIHWDKN